MKKVLFLFLVGLMGLTACEKEVQVEQQTELTEEFAELLEAYPELTTEELANFSSKTNSANTTDFPEVGDIIETQHFGTTGNNNASQCFFTVKKIGFGYSQFYQETIFLIKYGSNNSLSTDVILGHVKQIEIETSDCSPNYPSNIFTTYKAAAKVNGPGSGNYEWKQFACSPAAMTSCSPGETPKIVMGRTTDGRVMFVNW